MSSRQNRASDYFTTAGEHKVTASLNVAPPTYLSVLSNVNYSDGRLYHSDRTSARQWFGIFASGLTWPL